MVEHFRDWDCFCGSFLVGCSKQENSDVKTIGVLQYMEHAALDASYEGFVAALEAEGYVDGENIKFDLKMLKEIWRRHKQLLNNLYQIRWI